jgi:hypothetical protein
MQTRKIGLKVLTAHQRESVILRVGAVQSDLDPSMYAAYLYVGFQIL